MRSKGAVIGSTTALFVFTIAIVILLLIFVIESSAIRKLNESKGGLKVYDAEKTGLMGLASYMKDEFPGVFLMRYNNMRSEDGK